MRVCNSTAVQRWEAARPGAAALLDVTPRKAVKVAGGGKLTKRQLMRAVVRRGR